MMSQSRRSFIWERMEEISDIVEKEKKANKESTLKVMQQRKDYEDLCVI